MTEKTRIITLTTDFGSRDAFAGIMKGVILSIRSDVRIVDITHEIERHNIEEALYTLSYTHAYFQAGTIHVAVVDPGVGSGRRPLLVQSGQSLFLAPDNGVLSFLYDEENTCTVRVIESDQYFRKPVSQTFHGRDIFAPVAAWLANGIKPENVGPVITDYRRLNIPQMLISDQCIRGEIIHVDRFGNLITNIRKRHLDSIAGANGEWTLECKGVTVRGLYASYAGNTTGQPGIIINSFDLLEIFCYMGSVQEMTGLQRGDRIQVCLGKK